MNIFCAHCGQRYTVPEKLGGKQVKCKKCAALIAIPKIADKAEPAPLDDPLRSFFEQELPPSESETATVFPSATPQSPRIARPNLLNLLALLKFLFRGLISSIRRKPVLTSWAAVLVAFLISALLWLLGLWQLGMLWGSVCGFLGIVMGIGTIVWWFYGPRPNFNWGKYILFGILAMCASIGPTLVLKDMSRKTVGIVQMALCAMLLLYAVLDLFSQPRETRVRIIRGAFMFFAAAAMNILGGLIVIGMFFSAGREMLMARHGRSPLASQPAMRNDPPPDQPQNQPKPALVPHAPPSKSISSNIVERPRQQALPNANASPPRQPPQGDVNRQPARAERPAPDARQFPPARPRPSAAELPCEPTPAVEIPDVWEVQPDPSTEKIRLSSDLFIHLPEKISTYHDTLYPALPSRFVAIGSLQDRDKCLTVWDCESMKQVGEIDARKVFPSSCYALSPDGRFIAALHGDRGLSIRVWSMNAGEKAAEFPLLEKRLDRFLLQFSGADRLIAGITPEDSDRNRRKVQIWSISKSALENEFEVEIDSMPAQYAVLSPAGKYIAFAGKHLMIYELPSGKLVGARPFPISEGDRTWTCQGLAFSPDGAELVAFFDVLAMRRETRTIVWNVSDGRIVVDRGGSDRWISNEIGYFSSRAPWIQWMEGGKAWLIAGRYAVDRTSGKVLWECYSDRNQPKCLIDGKHVLAIGRTGLSIGLVVLAASPSKKPDFKDHPAVNFRASFLDDYKFKWYFRVQVIDYQGEGDIISAARRALDGVPMIDTDKIDLDKINNVLIVGCDCDKLCDLGKAKTALEKVGFKIGRTQHELNINRYYKRKGNNRGADPG